MEETALLRGSVERKAVGVPDSHTTMSRRSRVTLLPCFDRRFKRAPLEREEGGESAEAAETCVRAMLRTIESSTPSSLNNPLLALEPPLPF